MAHPSSSRSQPVLPQTITHSAYGLLPPPALYSNYNYSNPSSSNTTLEPRNSFQSSEWIPIQYNTNHFYAPVEELAYPQVNQAFQRTTRTYPQLRPQQLEENRIRTQNQDEISWHFIQPLPLPLPLSPEIRLPSPPVVNRPTLAQTLEEVVEPVVNYANFRKPFISKLSYLLRNPDLYSEMIMWNDDGTVFILAPSNRFLDVLSEIYSHRSLAAFCRQLNTYSFVHLSTSQLIETFAHSPDTITPFTRLSAWSHPLFTRSEPHLADRIRPVQSRARKAHKLAKHALMMETGRVLVTPRQGVVGPPLVVGVDRAAAPVPLRRVSKVEVEEARVKREV